MPGSPDDYMKSWASDLLTELDPGYFPLSPVEFAVRASGGYYYRAKHVDFLGQKLEDVATGRCKRLMILMPPRHSKSETTSKYYPAWFLGTFPDKRIILTSYEADFAAEWGREARNLVEEYGETLLNRKITLRQDSKSASRWHITGHRGGMVTAGVGGAITGRGSDLLIIDDPVKNDEQARSPTYREKTWNWYRSTAYTRLQPNGAIILIQTRWHKDDLAGRLLAEMENGGEQWEVIRLPALAEENDPLGRAPGEPLWPEQFSKENLLAIKAAVGSYVWNALYQQNPGDPEGNMFKRAFFRYFEVQGDQYVLHRPEGDKHYHRDNCIVFQTCDPAGSTKETADFFVLATWAATPQNELLLLEIIRDRLEGPDQPDILQDAYDRWHPVVQGVESKSMGLTLFQTLQRKALPVEALSPEADKSTRARPMAARYKSGMVYHKAHAHWLGEYEEELLGFPRAAHDDQVDVASYAFTILVDLDRYRPSEYQVGDYFL